MSHQSIPPISDKTEVILDHVTFITMESEIPNLPALMERKTVIVPWYSSYHPPEFEVNGFFSLKKHFYGRIRELWVSSSLVRNTQRKNFKLSSNLILTVRIMMKTELWASQLMRIIQMESTSSLK